ncbi:hypothetical protein [Paenibacillus thermotolerans]|uniref:hypothetical protein n=1 Tax=Paenibacillus thermotolerans TaxID=3027807 RepID=UPI0023679DEC|nr:hypothetical protein [Paenibacillus sp. YIM B05602]
MEVQKRTKGSPTPMECDPFAHGFEKKVRKYFSLFPIMTQISNAVMQITDGIEKRLERGLKYV